MDTKGKEECIQHKLAVQVVRVSSFCWNKRELCFVGHFWCRHHPSGKH